MAKDFDEIRLNGKLHITKAAAPDPGAQKAALAAVRAWAAMAEQVVSARPALKINVSHVRDTPDVPRSFKNLGDVHKHLVS